MSLSDGLGKSEEKTRRQYASVLIGVVVVIAGVVAGYFLSGVSAGGGAGEDDVLSTTQTSNEAGVVSEDFDDSAEGKLVDGGIFGEGTHHLEREGGESKYVYLNSTLIDLDSFVGKNVQVWGQTVAAQDAPWLMEVGRVKVIN